MLKLVGFTFNPFQENTYLLYDTDSLDLLIIDPGSHSHSEQKQLRDFIEKHHLRPQSILLTHAHIDHVLGLYDLQKEYGLSAYMHAAEVDNFAHLPQYAPLFGITDYRAAEVQPTLQVDTELTLGSVRIELREVPGHAPGHLVLYLKDQEMLIAGDTLFYEGIGRTDLPGGDHQTLLSAIQTQLYSLPDEVVVYPGHGPQTSIGHEKKHNPFVQSPK